MAGAKARCRALSVLACKPVIVTLQEQILEDTLRGADVAKRVWPDSGMTADIGAGFGAVRVPVTIVIGNRDQVEHEAAFREVFGHFLPQATYHVLDGVGHLSPLEAPDAVAAACRALCDTV